ncbi:MAG: endonuclease/exonuclease/phosphatase family protein [Actinomycetota bacterium]|nr:endonuclease/exonuclease/phosphatase family protein [Actinomycetota bacterium]
MSESAARGRGGPLLTVVLALGVCGVLGTALLRLVPVNTQWMFAALSFAPYILAGASALLLVALVARRWRHGAAAALAVALLAPGVLPRAFRNAQPDAGGAPLTVASANLYYGRADPRAVIHLVRTHQVDVLSLQELTPEAVAALDAAGLAALLPHRVFLPDNRAAGTGIASRYPLRSRPSNPDSYHFQPAVELAVPGTAETELTAVHIVAPVGQIEPSEWHAELAALPDAAAGRPTRILVGDFNATLDHRPLRDVLDTGYRDAADQAGKGLRATWPTDTPIASVAAIDHVLVDTSCAVRSFNVLPLPGSDHRALVAEIVLPG